MKSSTELDLLIIGGGVAGLWTLNHALRAGYSAILVEKAEIGGGQSGQSQGIIHGGGKYRLAGPAPVAQALAAMPQRWRACLSGRGEIDLSGVTVLSDGVYVWSSGGDALGEPNMGAEAAAARLRSGPQHAAASTTRATWPAAFADPGFRGRLRRLDEPVLDLHSLFQALADAVRDHLFQADAASLDFSVEQGRPHVADPRTGLVLRPARILVTAGAGLAELAGPLRLEMVAMQQRPLHMVAVRHRRPGSPPVFAHLSGADERPQLTVTTHPLPGGDQVWYLGGQLAEDGVGRGAEAQIAAAQDMVRDALSWLPPVEGDWLSLRISRAEPAQPGGARPGGAFVQAHGSCIVAWPTKLALAPDLADRVLAHLPQPSRHQPDLTRLSAWPRPPIARPVWERHFACN